MICNLLYHLYAIQSRIARNLIRIVVLRLEGGPLYSKTIRRIFKKYYDVEVGMYSYGACFEPFVADKQTRIGRYCSIAKGTKIVNHNHPLDFKSTHGFFFSPIFGQCKELLAEIRPLEIGNDVWICANAVILPEVNRIGDGAVIGAGAVVCRDVPPYAVVIGNPGRIVKYRFSEDAIRRLLDERWWDKDIDELLTSIGDFQKPFEPAHSERA